MMIFFQNIYRLYKKKKMSNLHNYLIIKLYTLQFIYDDIYCIL